MITNGVKRFFYLIASLLLITLNTLSAQELNDLFSYNNRLAFGNNLFCEKDYLRAIDEFNALLVNNLNDTLQFKVATSYYRMEQYNEAYIEFQKIGVNSKLYQQTENEKFRTLFKSDKYYLLQNETEKIRPNKNENLFQILRLNNASQLLVNLPLPEKNSFVSVYEEADKEQISEFYEWKENSPFKSPTKAAIMSAIIPGLGKVYANEIGDGITAFLLTGLFTYLAIDKFENQQQTSAWIYTALATFFYAGNIYGSATAVENYNAGIQFNFNNEVKLFVNKRNQFLPTPKFLCD